MLKKTHHLHLCDEPTRAVVLNRERTGGVRENFLKSTVDYYNKSPFVEGVRVSS